MNRHPLTRLARHLALAAALATAAATAHARVLVEDAWVRATVPQQKAAGAYMKLSAAEDTKLVAASSPVAAEVEVHEMRMEGDIMRMRAIPFLDLPAGKTVEARPGGYHFMLMNLRQPLRPGDTVPLKLVFEHKDGKRVTREVQAEVRAIDAGGPPPVRH
jgi:copper(I)-binding protein